MAVLTLLAQMAQVATQSNLSLLDTSSVLRGGLPNGINSMMSLGTPSWYSRSVPTPILTPNCLSISMFDILWCSYLTLCHLPYDNYNMIEIYIICHNLFSKTIIHYIVP